MKTQLLINPESGEIISLALEKGKVHNFQLFKSSKIRLKPRVQLTADSSIQDLQNGKKITFCQKKSSKNHPLSKQNRKQNKNISIKCITVELVSALVKRIRILSKHYRNRRKRFSPRFSLSASICIFKQPS